jgi:hypothetical protein
MVTINLISEEIIQGVFDDSCFKAGCGPFFYLLISINRLNE